MHSSRMRTAHTLMYRGSPSGRPQPPGQRPLPWTDTPWTETPLDRHPPTESQTRVKALPSRNFVAGGKSVCVLSTSLLAGKLLR